MRDESEVYAEILWSHHRFEAALAPQPVNPANLGIGRLLLPPSSAFYPAGLGFSGPLDLRYRTVPLGPRINRATTDQGRVLLGWRGLVADWDIDTAIAHAASRTRNDNRSGYVDAQGIVDAFATGLVNPFGDSGPEGNALLESSELRGVTRRGSSTSDSLDVRARRDLAKWRHGTLSVSVGAEARRETMRDEATALVERTVGAAVDAFYVDSTSGQRQSQAVFAEAIVPIASHLEAQLAVRTDHYSDFGTASAPKLALRWQPAPWLVVRGSAGRGFRAPSLAELHTAQRVFVASTGLPDPLRCPVTGLDADCFVETAVIVGGNPDLRPMTTRQQSLGVVLAPLRGLSLGVELWRVTTSGYIVAQGPIAALSPAAGADSPLVVRGAPDPANPTLPGPITALRLMTQNVGNFEVRGIDVDIRWQHRLAEAGLLTLAFNAEYTSKLVGQFDGVTYSSILGATSAEGLVAPRWEHRLSLTHEIGPWASTVSNRLRGGYVDRPSPPLPDRRVAGDITWNAQLAYSGWHTPRGDITFALGVINVFDRDPPFTRSNAGLTAFGYDPANADPRGRFVYANLKYRFR